MNKLLQFILSVLMFAAALMTPAFADIAGGAVLAMGVGVPLLIVTVLIVLTALLIRAIRKRRK